MSVFANLTRPNNSKAPASQYIKSAINAGDEPVKEDKPAETTPDQPESK